MTELDEATGAIARLIEEFAKLPGIGPKSAERMTHFLLTGDRRTARSLAEALLAVVEQVGPCRECFNLTEGDVCPVCADGRRDPSLICVVESPRDLAVLERAGTYRGRYHVLNGRLAPLDNVGPEQLTFDALLRRVQRGGVREVILATSPTLEGDGTALFAAHILAGTASGSSLELANAQMLADAMEGRRAF
jgi:recombination protein RecR